MTHALAGLLLGALATGVAPGGATVVLTAGLLGGVAPDLDAFAQHRRTLHFPLVLPLLTPLAVLPSVLFPGPVTGFVAVFVAAAALHSLMDVAGGGRGLTPWLDGDRRAVYSHLNGRWIESRGPIGYDGAPADLLLAVCLGLPLLLVVPEPFRSVTLGLLGLAAGYTVVRKRLVAILAAAVRLVPRPLRFLLPARMLEARREY